MASEYDDPAPSANFAMTEPGVDQDPSRREDHATIQGGSDTGRPAAVLDERVDRRQVSISTTMAAAPVVPPVATSPRGATKTRAVRRRRGRSSWFWRFAFPAVMVALTISVPLLVRAGQRTVLGTTDGNVLTGVQDPKAPGWRAVTDPTPTLLLVQTDAQGRAAGLTVLSLTGAGAGGVIFVPVATVPDVPGGEGIPLSVAAERGGLEALQQGVEEVLGVGMAETAIVSPAQWTDLVAPVAPLSFTNPDTVTVPNGNGANQVFSKGPISLEAKDVAAYLAGMNPGESELNRLVRHQLFWNAWLTKVGVSGKADAVPGETTKGVGRFVRALGSGQVKSEPLPVNAVPVPNSTVTVFAPIKDKGPSGTGPTVQAVVAALIPFPIGAPPGARVKVLLLDGTGKLDHGLTAAPLIVEGGGQVNQIGNADAFNVARTRLVYYDDSRRSEVEKLQQKLGVGELVKGVDAGSATDVTITLGEDFAQAPRPTSTTTSVGSGAGSTGTTMTGRRAGG